MSKLNFIFFLFFISTGAYAQYHVLKSRGDKAFENKNYYEAAYYYKQAVDGKKYLQTRIPFYSAGKPTEKQLQHDRPYIFYRLAESYRLYLDYAEAEQWYNKILTESHEEEYPLTRLWYGICLRANRHFDESIKQLQQFVTSYNGDNQYTEIAKREIENCLFAKWQYNSEVAVEVAKMQGQWNAGGGDYALVKNKENYWFTSTRFAGVDQKHLNKIYTSPAQQALPVIFDLKFDDTEKEAEYGTLSIDASGKQMYLTRWYKTGDKTILAIYHSEFVSNAWTVPQKLNSNVNVNGFNAFQPSVTTDGKRLFFSSDRPGGEGGDDIWVSNLDNEGKPVDAVNLGKTINTPLDEQAPFYDSVRQRLVFSSKGFTGLGGFDLFGSFENNGEWSVPQNLGYPVNSSKDDMYYYADPDDKNKFFISSDRESECCLNLFQGRYKQSVITGVTVSCDTLKLLQGVKVSLIDSASNQILRQLETGLNAKYTFEAADNHSYRLVFEKRGCFTKIISVAAKAGADTLFNPDVCLQGFKVDKPITIKNILYDFNKADLRPESKIALDTVVNIMKDNPSIKIELSSHTDSIGSDTYNLKLSQQRAQSCVDYIISKGIDKDRIVAKGYGKSVPIASNSLPNGKDNPDGRQLNRRTEFIVKRE